MWTYELKSADVAEAVASYFEEEEIEINGDTIEIEDLDRQKLKTIFELLDIEAPYAGNPDIEPSIYAACLAAYNQGQLHGVWLSAEIEPEDMQKAIRYMLLMSPAEGNAEEWAIHDTDNMEGLKVKLLSTNFEEIKAVGDAIAEHGEPVALFINESSLGQPIIQTIGEYPEKYKGRYDSEKDFVEDQCEANGWYDALEKAGINSFYLDIDAIKNDWFNDTYWSIRNGANCYIYER